MLYWVILFILGEVADRVFPISIAGMLAVGMAVIICAVPAVFFKQNRKILLIGILFFIIGMFCYSYVEKTLSFCRFREGENVAFSGIVTGIEDSEKGTCYFVKTKTISEKNLKTGIRIFLEKDYDIPLSSLIYGAGNVKAFSKATNPGGFDEVSYQFGNGRFLQLEDVRIIKMQKSYISIYEILYQIRRKLLAVYKRVFDEKNASLAGAMVLGDKVSLDTDIKELYRRNGIAHLIAISGLHIAMIGGVIYRILRKMFGSYSLAGGIGVFFIILYGIMTGLSGATCRAVIMLIISIGADVCGRRYDTITAVAIALLVMLIRNPFQITQAGFLLSFGAIIGIAVVYPVWKQVFTKIPKWFDGFFISLSVQLILLPVMLYFFYEVPVYGIFLNIIVVPLMSILLALLILCGIAGCIFVQAGFLFARFADVIFYIYELLCKASEPLPFHSLCTGRPSVYWICLYYIVLAILLVAGYQKRFRMIVVSGGVYLGLFVIFVIPSSLKLCMFDVGQGDGLYVRTPGGKHILIDGGSSSKQKVGNYVLKNGMKYYGGNEIDYVFVSHLDSDHYNGILELLEDETVEVKNFFLPDIANPDEEYQELERKAEEKECKIYHLKRNDSLVLDGVTFLCLNPVKRVYDDKNQGSMVLLMTYRDFQMLFTGDMDETVEKEIISQLPDRVSVLKVAHHGSATASSEAFLRQIKPDTAWISVGKKNRYGHPAKEVMEHLNIYCEKIYLTKDNGAITIDTNGKKYRIKRQIEN